MALLLLSPSSWRRNTPRIQGRQMLQIITTPMWSFFLVSSVRYRGYVELSLPWGPVKNHLPPPLSPAGPSRCFALCLPIKSTLYLHEQHVEGVAHQKHIYYIYPWQNRGKSCPQPGAVIQPTQKISSHFSASSPIEKEWPQGTGSIICYAMLYY